LIVCCWLLVIAGFGLFTTALLPATWDWWIQRFR
jgi:hypothetical protein